MTTVRNSEIAVTPTPVQCINRHKEIIRATKAPPLSPSDEPLILQYEESFLPLIGPSPTHSLLASSAETSKNPFFHEACVYISAHDELYLTSNLLSPNTTSRFPTILISRLKFHRSPSTPGGIHTVEWVKMRPPSGIDMPNGAVNDSSDGIIFCAQGTTTPGSGGIYHMPRHGPAMPLITNWHGRDFNSPNDVVVAADGAVWFTDPCYAFEGEFRGAPQLPNQVYRFDPVTGDVRVVADGFGRPNGICFDPGEGVVYITDTDFIRGDGSTDLSRVATIYAFDIVKYSNAPFLINRRVFAYVASGAPDGIKCDVFGNVYSGCGDGIEVWNSGGTLIGRIVVPGGVANFCFGREGEMFLCAEQRLWRVQLARETKGALLRI